MLKRIEYAFGRTGGRLIRVAHFLKLLRIGLWYDYPLCCVLHFAWDRALFRRHPGVLRGSINGDTERSYVPCRLHMRRHPTWKPYNTKPHSQLRLFSDKVGRV